MKILLSMIVLISSTAFAETVAKETPKAEFKTFKSMDNTYEVKVQARTLFRCHKDNFFMNYTLHDDQDKACALTYEKIKCGDSNCADGKRQELQAEKTIAVSRFSPGFCKNKLTTMVEKFKAQGFACDESAIH